MQVGRARVGDIVKRIGVDGGADTAVGPAESVGSGDDNPGGLGTGKGDVVITQTPSGRVGAPRIRGSVRSLCHLYTLNSETKGILAVGLPGPTTTYSGRDDTV
jgi:hypothetical protein